MPAQLGIVFDLDGTLIAEGEAVKGVCPRPAAADFLQWLLDRGHRLAIWTAAHPSWAHCVSRHFCNRLVDHDCEGTTCRRVFDFVWDVHRLTCGDLPGGDNDEHSIDESSNHWDDTDCDDDDYPQTASDSGCHWCLHYSADCDRCYCASSKKYCPCRHTKQLTNVWREMSSPFQPTSTLIIENTPQQCIYNDQNAIYIPTFTGETEPDVFGRLRQMITKLEAADDVRSVIKCDHGPGPHACREQSWLDYCQPCGERNEKNLLPETIARERMESEHAMTLCAELF